MKADEVKLLPCEELVRVNNAIINALLAAKPGAKRTVDMNELYDGGGEHFWAAEIPIHGAWMTVCTLPLARAAIEATRPTLVTDELVERAWREGFQLARECLSDDEAFALTEDVEEDCWCDSNFRKAIDAMPTLVTGQLEGEGSGFYAQLSKLAKAGKWKEALALMRTPGLPAMCQAFRTTVSGEGRFEMVFRFGSIEDMHEADREWHEFLTAIEATRPAGQLDQEELAEAVARVTPNIFDLLEPLGRTLLANGGPDIRGYYARATGGVDIPYIIEALTGEQTDD